MRLMLKSKIHRATVTGASIDYEGSISIDSRLMAAADIREYEQVQVLDLDNGARLTTYAIAGAAGEICLNGAAARLVTVGDRVIILTYHWLDEAECGSLPVIIHVDEKNAPVARTGTAAV